MRRKVHICLWLQCRCDDGLDVTLKKLAFKQSENTVCGDQSSHTGPSFYIAYFLKDSGCSAVRRHAESANYIICQAKKVRQTGTRSGNSRTSKEDHTPFVSGG